MSQQDLMPALQNAPRQAPFLVWPVARREFYLSIALALLPTLAWGWAVFGFRALVLNMAVVLGAVATHALVRRFTRRGKSLLLGHSLVSALLVAALCQPLWPAWTGLAAGVAVVGLLWALGGPGHERVHASMFIYVVLALVLMPLLASPAPPASASARPSGAILARDRLFMGDLRNYEPAPAFRWPRSRELGGDDAALLYRPAVVANGLLNTISSAARQSGPDPVMARRQMDARISPILEEALVADLPPIELVILGAVPGPVGVVSCLGIFLGGLYLAYRHILRGRSWGIFVGAFFLTLLITAVSPATIHQLGGYGLTRLWRLYPGPLLTLIGYSFFGSDILFAAVFLLAMPGTEPITPRGRRVFLLLAGIAAAALHRSNVPLPAATLTLVAFQPFAPLFDRGLARRSWLNR